MKSASIYCSKSLQSSDVGLKAYMYRCSEGDDSFRRCSNARPPSPLSRSASLRHHQTLPKPAAAPENPITPRAGQPAGAGAGAGARPGGGARNLPRTFPPPPPCVRSAPQWVPMAAVSSPRRATAGEPRKDRALFTTRLENIF
jgi:hypothetical protein